MSKVESKEKVVEQDQKDLESGSEPAIGCMCEPEPQLVCKCQFEPEPVAVCKCLTDVSSEKVFVSARKQAVLNAAATVESFIRERRIAEFFHFLLAKLLSDLPDRPISYFEKLLDDCMLFRSGHGLAPVLFEDQHLQAVIRSFDPGDRGWLSAGQIRRIYATLNIPAEKKIEEKVSTDVVFKRLKSNQEKELYKLLTAGMDYYQEDDEKSTKCENGSP